MQRLLGYQDESDGGLRFASVYEIPVVAHILMDDSCTQGAISNDLLYSQIEILNEDFLALLGTNGESVFVGTIGDDDVAGAAGAVYVYERSGPVWTLEAKIAPNDAILNAYVLKQGGWSEAARIKATQLDPFDNFGFGIAFSGAWAIVGAWNDDDLGADAGTAYTYSLVGLSP